MKDLATILKDIGSVLKTFTQADPSKVTNAVVEAMPTIISTVQAEQGVQGNTMQMVKAALSGAEVIANQNLTGGAAKTATEIESGLPSLMQLITDLTEIHQAATATPLAAPRAKADPPA